MRPYYTTQHELPRNKKWLNGMLISALANNYMDYEMHVPIKINLALQVFIQLKLTHYLYILYRSTSSRLKWNNDRAKGETNEHKYPQMYPPYFPTT